MQIKMSTFHSIFSSLRSNVVALAALFCAVEVVAFAVAVEVIGNSGTSAKVLADLIYPELEAVAVIALTLAARRAPTRTRRWFLLGMTASTLLGLCGDATWAVIDLGLNQVAAPSVADAFYIAGLAAISPALIVEFGSPLRRWREFIDLSIACCAALFAGWQWLIEPEIQRGLTAATLVAVVETILALIVAIGALSAVCAAARKPALGVRLITTAIVIQAASWVAYTYVVQVDGVLDVSWVLVGWQITWSLLIVGAVASLASCQAEPSSILQTPGRAHPRLLTTGLLLVLAVFVIDSHAGRLNASAIGLGIVVTLLVVVRLQLALRERGLLADTMQRLATTDSLTGIPNRRAFDNRVAEAVARARRSAISMGILIIDADNFKQVNDGFGHPAGDAVLRQVAHRLTTCVRPADMVARMGGEEFALLAEDIDPGGLTELGERCRHALADHPIIVGSMIITLTASVGAACMPAHAQGADELLRVADQALYEAKRAGRNRTHLGFANSPQRKLSVPDSPDLTRLEVLADQLDSVQARQEHSMAMVDVCARLCDTIGLSVAQRRRCTVAARLHDIGKLGTPPFILTKPHRLTATERRVMQDHVRVGTELLRSIPEAREFVRAVSEHHERFDGRGYPNGKARDQISIEARIIAVADAWTAMLADRPYRPALTLDNARAELQAGAGAQFDPAIVAALLALIDTGKLDAPATALTATA